VAIIYTRVRALIALVETWLATTNHVAISANATPCLK
jgi:hypothetical protein